MCKTIESFNKASGNKPESKWGRPIPFRDVNATLDKWERELARDKRIMRAVDWCFVIGGVATLLLVLL